MERGAGQDDGEASRIVGGDGCVLAAGGTAGAGALLPGKQYLRKPGAGRPPKPARQVFEAIVYVLRTGCQWKALPGERFGSASAIHKRFLEWAEAGFSRRYGKAGLAEYDEMEGIA